MAKGDIWLPWDCLEQLLAVPVVLNTLKGLQEKFYQRERSSCCPAPEILAMSAAHTGDFACKRVIPSTGISTASFQSTPYLISPSPILIPLFHAVFPRTHTINSFLHA